MTLPDTVRQLGGDARIVFDVGAAEGKTAAKYLKLFPRAVVYAFEPTPGLCKLRSGKRVKVVKQAVLDREGTTLFHINTKPHVNSVLPFTGQFKLMKTKRVIEVPCITLDGFCVQHKISRVDVLKIDVQGVELQVLRGAEKLFSRGAVGVVVVELQHAPVYKGQRTRGAVGKFLARHGFTMRAEYPAHRGNKLIHSNGVFAR
jgi:FkbM family methyltransferase